MTVNYLYPNGGKRAATFSYDDGRAQDRRLVALFNKHGLKGTFHLNSGTLGVEDKVRADEVKALYEGHEVACHTVDHPFLSEQPAEAVLWQLLEDRKTLEALTGRPVRGFSYPFGDAGGRSIELLKAAGFDYARTTGNAKSLLWPEDFMLWDSTCHHKGAAEAIDRFNTRKKWHQLTLLYIWGHSYEFDNDDNWDWFEGECARLAAETDVWFATNGQLEEYITAVRRVKWSVDCASCINPSAVEILVERGGKSLALKPGVNKLP